MVFPSEATITYSREAVLRERVGREKARRHVVDFMEYVSPWYRGARFHRFLGSYLEEVARFIESRGQEGIGRLLISLPPRHGKSEMVSRHFPAWVLGKLPNTRIILASYGADLAEDHSRAARNIVVGERYEAVFGVLAEGMTTGTTDLGSGLNGLELGPNFGDGSGGIPVEVSSDSRSVRAWDLAAPHRGGVAAAGVGGGITGKGAHLLVIDDPFKNRKEAESESYRQDVWDWWTSSAYTRLEDGGAVIGMFTRWHADDWAGRLLKAMGEGAAAEVWRVISLPALAEEANEREDFGDFLMQQLRQGVWVNERDPMGRKAGEALWPEKYGVEDLERIRGSIGVYDWEALYQQQPFLRAGTFFQREWFPVVEAGPKAEEVAERVRFWDKAASASGDYTVGVLMCRTGEGVYFVEHVVRGQWSPGEREGVMAETARFDLRREGMAVQTWHQQDPGSAGRDSAEATNRNLAEAGMEARFETLTGDKLVRAGPWSSLCQGGGARLVRGGWNEAFIEEHVAFPLGKYDDQVDAASSAFGKLASRVVEGRLFW